MCSLLIDGVSMRCAVPKVNGFGVSQLRERLPHGPRTVRPHLLKIQADDRPKTWGLQLRDRGSYELSRITCDWTMFGVERP
jgi:hypothetical protein